MTKIFKEKYVRLTLEQKLEIISYSNESNISNCEILSKIFSQKFKLNLKRRTINDLIRNKNKIIEKSTSFSLNSKSSKNSSFKILDRKLENWIDLMSTKNAIINDNLLIQKASTFADEMKMENFKCSRGFINNFKRRHGYQLRKVYWERKTDKMIDFKNFMIEYSTLKEKYKARNIFNIDETGNKNFYLKGLFYKLIPSKTICKKETEGFKKLKNRVSLLLCANSDGSEKIKPLIIGRFKSPRCFKNFDYKKYVDYSYNKTCWMSKSIFNSWIYSFNEKMKKQNRKILLLLDNCPSHIILQEYSNINLKYLPPNSSGYIQPMDQGIIASFKSYFNRFKLNFITQIVENSEINVYKAYKSINLKNVILFTNMAWKSVKTDTLKNGFNKLSKSIPKVDKKDKICRSVNLFVKSNNILDPINAKQFMNYQFNENDALLENINHNQNNAENDDEIESNEEKIQYKKLVTKEDFELSLNTTITYLTQNDENPENFILLGNLLKYNEKRSLKEKIGKGIKYYFGYFLYNLFIQFDLNPIKFSDELLNESKITPIYS